MAFIVINERRDSFAEIILRFDPVSNRVNLLVVPNPSIKEFDGQALTSDIPADRAGDAFEHPFAYVPAR
jgi:hypothetical protein